MGQTDKQFGGFLRMLIARMKNVIEEKDPDKARKLLEEILSDLQNTLEDWTEGGGAMPSPVQKDYGKNKITSEMGSGEYNACGNESKPQHRQGCIGKASHSPQ